MLIFDLYKEIFRQFGLPLMFGIPWNYTLEPCAGCEHKISNIHLYKLQPQTVTYFSSLVSKLHYLQVSVRANRGIQISEEYPVEEKENRSRRPNKDCEAWKFSLVVLVLRMVKIVYGVLEVRLTSSVVETPSSWRMPLTVRLHASRS